jgi:DNA-binding beta-propeller fold protein YncE
MKSVSLITVLALALTAPAAELELVQTIPLKGKAGNLDHLALDGKRDRLLVANKANNTLDVVDLKTGKLLKQVPNQTGIQGIAYAADLDRVYVGLGTNGLCNILDGGTYKAGKTIKFADDCDNVRYNPKTQIAYVAHAESSLGVINAKTNALKIDIKLPGQAESFQLESNRPRLYMNIPSPSQVAVIDTEKNEVVSNFPVKIATGGHPLALDEANHRLYIGCRKEPMVVILDSENGKEIAGVPIPGDVDDLFLDAGRKRIYASCGEGFIAVLKVTDTDHIEVVEKIATTKGARTCLYVPETGRLYLAVPRQEGKDGPEIRVFQAK